MRANWETEMFGVTQTAKREVREIKGIAQQEGEGGGVSEGEGGTTRGQSARF